MSTKTRTETTAAPANHPAPVAVGDTVRFRGGPATIIAFNEDGTADLLHLAEGRRRIADRVPRGLEFDRWATPDDIEQARPLSPRELWQEAKDRGDLVPEVGMIVSYAHDIGPVPFHEIVVARGRIAGIASLDGVALEILGPEPAEVDGPETVILTVPQSSHVRTATVNQRKMFFAGMWSFRDENFIVPAGPTAHSELYPAKKCGVTSCRKGTNHTAPLDLGDGLVVEACNTCIDRARQVLGYSPLAPPPRPPAPETLGSTADGIRAAIRALDPQHA